MGDVFAIRKRFHNSQQALAHSLYSKDGAVVGCQHDFIFFRVDKLEPKLPTSCAVEFGTCDVNMEVSECDWVLSPVLTLQCRTPCPVVQYTVCGCFMARTASILRH